MGDGEIKGRGGRQTVPADRDQTQTERKNERSKEKVRNGQKINLTKIAKMATGPKWLLAMKALNENRGFKLYMLFSWTRSNEKGRS